MSGAFARDRVPDWSTYADREAITLVGRGKWRTTACTMHGGSDSLRVNVESGGWCCMGCGVKGGDTLGHYQQVHGLGFMEAARALGAVDDTQTAGRPERARAMPLKDSLELLYQDTMLVYVASCNLAQGMKLTDKDRGDLAEAARRILLVSQEARP